MAATARNTGIAPASTKVGGMPIHSPTGPATAMDTGISASETKKSRLETRPSRCGGTRRCSSVPQMTIAACPVKPTANDATAITQAGR